MPYRTSCTKVLKWSLALLCLAACGGGAYGYWLWSRSDELLLRAILEKQAEFAPHWELEIGRARFDWNRRVHVYDLALKARGQASPVVTVPEVVLTIDRENFRRNQRIVVNRVRLVRPRASLVRTAAGEWNWKALLVPRSEQSLPEWEVEQASLRIQLEQPDGAPPAAFGIDHADVRLIPSGKRRYAFAGAAEVEQAGRLALEGTLDVDSLAWTLDGEMRGLPAGGELLALAAGASPQVRTRIARADAALWRLDALPGSDPKSAGTPFSLATAQRQAAGEAPSREGRGTNAAGLLASRLPVPPSLALEIQGLLDVNFRVSQAEEGRDPAFQCLATLRQAQLNHPGLPFPLDEIEGQVYWDEGRVVIRNMRARNGVTRLSLSGELEKRDEAWPGRFALDATNVVLDGRLRRRLPEGLGRQYDLVNPAGHVDLESVWLFDGGDHWEATRMQFTAKDCSATPQPFPYLVTGIRGTMRQEGRDFRVALEGRAGRQPVNVNGWIRNPGPMAEAVFDVVVPGFPLDDRFFDACPPHVQAAVKSIRPKGHVDAALRLHRPPGLGSRFETKLSARLLNASVETESFPYRLSSLQGAVTYDSARQFWEFRELRGTHGAAQVLIEGSYTGLAPSGRLDLTVETQGVHFDKQLHLALPPALQKVWDDFSPTGRVNALVRIAWVAGRPLRVAIPRGEIYDGGMEMKAFQYPLDDIRATFTYADDRLHIHSFSATHDETRLRGKGFALCPLEGEWRVRLDELVADDLVPDRLFRRALNPTLRHLVDALDPRGPVSMAGMLEFRGTSRPEDPVTAAWDLRAVFTGGRVSAGVDLHNLNGAVSTHGTWDGTRAEAAGWIDLESVYVREFQFTRVQGPFELKDRQLTIGSRQALVPVRQGEVPRPVPADERVTVRILGGVLTLDAAVVLQDDPSYRLKVTLRDGDLEEYAHRHLPGTSTIRGRVSGWADVSGRGASLDQLSGRGKLQISPAALYELPLIARVLQMMTLSLPDNRAAFNYAFLDFRIADGQLLFDTIDLVGDSMRLLGQGTARFDGRLRLDFYSLTPRTRLPVPLVNAVLGGVGEATSRLIAVEVTGRVDAPNVKTKPVPALDDAMRGLLRSLEIAPPPQAPRLTLPPSAMR